MANTVVSLISILLLYITAAQGKRTMYATKEFSASSPVNNYSMCKTVVETQGYLCEEHKVTTEDGYILSLQRIPARLSGKKADKPPVLIQHGIFFDGIVWLLNSPEESLGFILADSGFDVWLVNGRGTKYSTVHTSLSPDDMAYWDWSWDELANYDLPALVQYVYNHTGQKKYYAGHSQGSLMAFVALSPGKLFNMLRSAALLSPIAHMNLILATKIRLLVDKFLAEAVYRLGFFEARKACCGTGILEVAIFCNPKSLGTCANASGYVFWDSFHPKEATNKMLMDRLIPTAMSLLLPNKTLS